MSIQMQHSEADAWLKTLKQRGRVYGPVSKPGKGTFSDTTLVTYEEVHSMNDLVLDQKTYLSPKQYAFPTRETLFHFTQDEVSVPDIVSEEVFIFLRACDVNGFHRLDTIFLNNGSVADPYYKRRREQLRFILLPCPEKGFKSCFCDAMGTRTTEDYCGFVYPEDDHWVISLEEGDTFTKFAKSNQIQVDVPEPGTIDASVFEHELWQEYTQRCIACGRCNTSCVTCSCFTMQDISHTDGQQGERRRRWASCHVKGYTEMAGGHGFRKKNGERMRFKTMHKIHDFHKRFGEHHMCVGCGRCDDVCPEYISFSTCINKVQTILKEKAVSHDK